VVFLSNLERSLGISLGLIGGVVIGMLIGRSKDAQAAAEGNVL
jgi:ABC-type nitrate/sulfonate/bicarbonate transport system permease component